MVELTATDKSVYRKSGEHFQATPEQAKYLVGSGLAVYSSEKQNPEGEDVKVREYRPRSKTMKTI